MLNKITKKTIILFAVVSISISSFSNCFGEFALTRSFYTLNKSLKIDGHPYIRKTLRTIFMVVLSPIYFFSGLADLAVFNVIEYWRTEKGNPLCNYDADGVCAVYYEKENRKMSLNYSEFGKKLTIQFSDSEKKLVVFKNKPEQFFTEQNGKLIEVSVLSKKVQDKTILKLTENGKTNSQKVISTEELINLENKVIYNF